MIEYVVLVLQMTAGIAMLWLRSGCQLVVILCVWAKRMMLVII